MSVNAKTLYHYRIYMKAYGTLIAELADHEEEVIKIIEGDDLGPLLNGLRELIENSPMY